MRSEATGMWLLVIVVGDILLSVRSGPPPSPHLCLVLLGRSTKVQRREGLNSTLTEKGVEIRQPHLGETIRTILKGVLFEKEGEGRVG